MVDHKQVYLNQGEQYQQLVAREDYQGNLYPAIRAITPLEGLDVVDLGSGTGRLVSLVGASSQKIYAFDLSHHMLRVGKRLFEGNRRHGWLAAAADHRAIPLPKNAADVILSGWSFCYLAVWGGENWKSALERGLSEVDRVLREKGWVIIIETLGTGVVEPEPPDKLLPYFKFLKERGFKQERIRTDYQFRDRDEARELVSFFFGKEMLTKINQGPQPILPEWTGIWSCRADHL